MEQVRSTVWATGKDLMIHISANSEVSSTHCGVKWEVGKTVYDFFKARDQADLGVAAHLSALAGKESQVRLSGAFANRMLSVRPLADESGDVMGCISVLNVSGDVSDVALAASAPVETSPT